MSRVLDPAELRDGWIAECRSENSFLLCDGGHRTEVGGSPTFGDVNKDYQKRNTQ